MHRDFEGTMKKLFQLWFDQELKNKPFSVSKLVNVFDDCLEALNVPSIVPGKPRAVSIHLYNWKASEDS